MIVKIDIPNTSQLVKLCGLGNDGVVQIFHTANVLRRILKYVPKQTGVTEKLILMQTDILMPKIVMDFPYAEYLRRGKVMVNAKTGKGPGMIPGVGLRYRKGTILKVTDRNLDFSKGKNKKAGPYFDKLLVANESDAMLEDLQNYADRRMSSKNE